MKILKTLAAALALGAAAPAAAQQIDVGIFSDIASTEFATKHDDNTMMVLHHVLESLVAYRDDMTLAPNLAEGWTVSDDGRTYTFKLRQGVKFHNGAPLTSREVAWTWARYLDPKRDWGSHCREQMDGSFEEYIRPAYVTRIETPDAATVRFHLQSPSAMFLHHMANNHCVYGIIHPDSVGQDGAWVKPIGTGPYKLAEWTPGEHVILKRFKDYRPAPGERTGLAGARKALADTIKFTVVDSPERARAMLGAGTLDIVPNVPLETAASFGEVAGVDLVTQVTPAFFQLIVQSRTDPMLRDPRMRRAIAYAIDRGRLVREVFGELVTPNPSVVAQTMPAYGPAHRQTLGYDPAKARELLRQAGYDGAPVEIMSSGVPYAPFLAAAQSAATMMREAGIDAKVAEVEWAEQDRRYAANEYQLTTIAFSARTDPTLMYSAMVGQKGDHSWYLWEDMQAESLVTETAIVADPAARSANYEALHRKMLDWAPTIGLSNYPRVDAVRGLKGYEGWTLAIPRFWGVTE